MCAELLTSSSSSSELYLTEFVYLIYVRNIKLNLFITIFINIDHVNSASLSKIQNKNTKNNCLKVSKKKIRKFSKNTIPRVHAKQQKSTY